MRDSTSYADPGLKMRDTFALATVLTLKSDPEHPLFKGANTVSPTSKSQQTLATAKFLTDFIISIAVLENVPLSRVTEKSNFSTLNVGLAGTGNRTRATCMAGSVSRRSAIHYASRCMLCLSASPPRKRKTHFGRPTKPSSVSVGLKGSVKDAALSCTFGAFSIVRYTVLFIENSLTLPALRQSHEKCTWRLER
jgi:hypothetical protein